MKFLERFFGRSTPAPAAEAQSYTAPTAAPPRLLYNPHLTETDGPFVKLLCDEVAARLENQRVLHLDVFREALAKREPELPPAVEIGADLESLAEALEQWDSWFIADMHVMVTKARQDGDNDVLSVFFNNSVNATNYDAMILEDVMRVATATFNDALALVMDAYPSLTKEEVYELQTRWIYRLIIIRIRWKRMHQDRFNAVYQSWANHQHSESLANAFFAMCQSHFRTEAQNMVQRYRETMLPMVTCTFAERDLDASNVVDADALAVMRSAAFDGFPVADAWERTPALARAYMLAWFDVYGKASDAKESALASGREQYASEIKAMDSDAQFARFGEGEMDEQFAPLFDEVKAFYVSRMTAT